MRIPIAVFLLGLMMTVAAPIEAGILDTLKKQTKKRLLEEAVEKVTDPDKGGKDEQDEDKADKPRAEQACKDLGLEWITPWNPKLKTFRKLPAWADYVLTLTETGEIQSADLIDASAKGIRKLGSSKKVRRILLAQKITATGSALQCTETLYFYKDPRTGKSMMPESRCSQSPELCVKG